jgi:hypothetical protein
MTSSDYGGQGAGMWTQATDRLYSRTQCRGTGTCLVSRLCLSFLVVFWLFVLFRSVTRTALKYVTCAHSNIHTLFYTYCRVNFLWSVCFFKKMAVFWVVAPCRLLSVDQRYWGPYCLQLQGNTLSNVVKLTPAYIALQPRRQPSSYSLHWEPQVLIISVFRN